MSSVRNRPPANAMAARAKMGSPWWVGLIAALATFLWFANLLPIQQVEFRMVATLAISQHRLPLLLNLLRTPANAGCPHVGLPFVINDIQLVDVNGGSEAAQSDLRTTRITVTLKKRFELAAIEKHLDQLTTPNDESSECKSLVSSLRKEKWRHETQRHQLQRLELDAARETEAKTFVSVDSTSNQAAYSQTLPVPIRLVSVRRDSSAETMAGSRQQLIKEEKFQAARVQELTENLERLREKARGFLTLTGSPSVHPVPRRLTIPRLLIVICIVIGIWTLLSWLAVSPKQSGSTKVLASKRSLFETTDSLEHTLRWLQSSGITYLGAVQWSSNESRSKRIRMPLAKKLEIQSATLESPIHFPLVFLKRIGELGLSGWVLVLLLRMSADTAWRELVFMAPLAAISRLISGV